MLGSVGASRKKVAVRVRRTPQSTLRGDGGGGASGSGQTTPLATLSNRPSRPGPTPGPSSKPSRTSSSSSVAPILFPSSSSSMMEKVVVFTPGPVGLELEPVNENPFYGCRIARFVDGGPHQPGQARLCGKMQPGDLVLQVQAEGCPMTATTYDEIIRLMKISHVKRIMTVQSVWEEEEGRDDEEIDEVMPPTNTPFVQQQHRGGFIATKQKSKSSRGGGRGSGKNNQNIVTNYTPSLAARPSPPSTPQTKSPGSFGRVQFVHSPSDMVLLSNSWEESSSAIERSNSASDTASPTSTLASSSHEHGPVIVPIENVEGSNKDSSVNHSNNSATTEHDEQSGLVYRSPPPSHTSRLHTSRVLRMEDESEKVVMGSMASESVHSQHTAKSSNKSATLLASPPPSMPRQNMADQFLLLDGYAGIDVPDSPDRSSSHSMDGDSESDQSASDTINSSIQDSMATTERTRVSSGVVADDSTDKEESEQIAKSPSLRLRADFEHRLETARVEYSQTERSLKELYEQTMKRNESKMNDLQSANQNLLQQKSRLETQVLDLQDRLQLAENDAEAKQTRIEDQLQRMVDMEDDSHQTITRLEAENAKLTDEGEANAVALDMSRSMVTDLGQQILSLSSERDELDAKLQKLQQTTRYLENSVQEKDAILTAQAKEVEAGKADCASKEAALEALFSSTQEMESTHAADVRGLEERIQDLMSSLSAKEVALQDAETTTNNNQRQLEAVNFVKNDCMARIEKLTRTNQNLQREKADGLAVISQLRNENAQLKYDLAGTKERESTLRLESKSYSEKLEAIEGELNQARCDVAQLDGQLMEKLEKGEVYTEADLQEKDVTIHALRLEIQTVNNKSLGDVARANKDALMLHLKLRASELLALEVGRELALSFSNSILLRDEMTKLSSQLEATNIDLEKIKGSLKTVNQELDGAKTRNDEQEKRINSLEAERIDTIERHRLERETMACQAHEVADDLSNARFAISHLENECSLLKKATEGKDELDSLLLEKLNVEKALKIELVETKEKMDAKSHELKLSRARCRQLEGECEIHQVTSSNLRQQVESMLEQYDVLDASKRQEVEAFSSLLASIKEDVHRTRTYLTEVETECTIIEKMECGLSNKLESLEVQKKEADAINERRVQDLEVAYAEVDASRKDILKTLDVLMRDKEHLVEKSHQDLEGQAAQHLAKEAAFEADQAKLLNGLGVLSTKLSSAQSIHRRSTKSLSAELHSASAELSVAHSKIQNLEAACADAHKTEEMLRCSLESLKNEKLCREEELQQANADLKCRLEAAVDEASLLRRDYAEQTIENDALCQKMEALAAEKSEIMTMHARSMDAMNETVRSLEAETRNLSGSTLGSLEEEAGIANLLSETMLSELTRRLATELLSLKDLLHRSRLSKSRTEKELFASKEALSRVEMEKEAITTKAQAEKENLEEQVLSLRKSLIDLQDSKDAMLTASCSEVFRLVKRVAATDTANQLLVEEGNGFAQLANNFIQSEELLNSRIATLELDLKEALDENARLEDELEDAFQQEICQERNLANPIEESGKIQSSRLELDGLQIDDEPVTQMEVSTLKLEIERYSEALDEMTKTNAELQTTLDQTILQSKSDLSDSKIEFSILQSAFNSMVTNKDEAILKSESIRTSIARSLFQANGDVASLRVQLEQRDSNLDELQQLLEESEASANKLERDLIEFRDGVSQDNDQIESQMQQIDLLETTVANLRFEIMEKDIKLAKIEQDRVAALRAVSELKSIQSNDMQLLEVESSQIRHLSSRLQKKEDSILELESTLREAEQRADEAYASISKAQQSEKELRIQFKDWQQCLKTEVMKLKRANHETLALVEDRAARNQSQSEANLDQLRNLEFDLSSATREMEDLVRTKHTLERNLEAALEKKASSEVACGELQEDINCLETKLRCVEANLIRERDEKQERILSLQKQVLSARAAFIASHLHNRCVNQEAKSEISELVNVIARLNDQIALLEEETTRNKSRYLEAEIILKKQISNLRAAHVVAHLETRELKKDTVSLLHSGTESKSLVTKLYDEKAHLEATIAELHTNVDANQDNLAKLQNQIEELRLEKSAIEKRADATAKRCSHLESTVQDLAIEKQEKDKLIGQLEQELKSNREETEVTARKVELQSRELTESLTALKAERARLDGLVSVEKAQANELVSLRRLVKTIQLGESQLEMTRNELRALKASNECLRQTVVESDKAVEDLQQRLSQNESILDDLQLQCREKERHIMHLEDEIDELQTNEHDEIGQRECKIASLADSIEHMKAESLQKETELIQLQQALEGMRGRSGDGTYTSTIETNQLYQHLSCVKAAFRHQKEVVSDMQLSETVLTDFMDEVMSLAQGAEKEALVLSAKLAEVEDLQLNPSKLISSLDLAGLDSSIGYIEDVRTRLDEMASTAYTTCKELKTRQEEFLEWKSNRSDAPATPVTPPPPAKPSQRVLFDTDRVDNIQNTMMARQSQMAGARLLRNVLEKRSKSELATAFRKWSCCVCAGNASCTHKETAVALAQQLKITREKLVVLKSHLKEKKRYVGVGEEEKRRKPRLRRILERLDRKDDSESHGGLETVLEGSGTNEDSFVL